jgi:uncharacterized membrane protein (DUF2068 family)
MAQTIQDTSTHRSSSVGLNVVITFKFVKSFLEVLIGSSLLVIGSSGLAKEFAAFSQSVRHHAAQTWSISLAEKLVDVSTAHNIFVIAIALLIDGLLTGFEGWALRRGYAWSRWLVVATTTSLIPFELITLTHHPSAGRFVILAANTLVVGYLVRSELSSAFAR